MKLVSVVGARPNFVKLAAIARAIGHSSLPIQHLVVHTGQHYGREMSQIFFEDLDLPAPDYHLGVGSGTHAEQTGKVMIEVERVLLREKPDVLAVVGDVNSTLGAALAAVKMHYPVAHVEAGARTYDMRAPEEVNRVVTDHISSALFGPTQNCVDNLAREGITRGVYLAGDTMLDSYLAFSPIAEKKSGILSRLHLANERFVLATVHHARNADDPDRLKEIVAALVRVGDTVVFPLHPRTEKSLRSCGLYERLKAARNIRVIGPVGYFDSLVLLRNARKVVTDSDGLQREAYFAGVPCITLAEATAWVETVEDGWNALLPPDEDRIVEAIQHFDPRGPQRDVFGDGNAAERIIGALAGVA